MESSRNLISTIGAQASPTMGDGTRCHIFTHKHVTAGSYKEEIWVDGSTINWIQFIYLRHTSHQFVYKTYKQYIHVNKHKTNKWHWINMYKCCNGGGMTKRRKGKEIWRSASKMLHNFTEKKIDCCLFDIHVLVLMGCLAFVILHNWKEGGKIWRSADKKYYKMSEKKLFDRPELMECFTFVIMHQESKDDLSLKYKLRLLLLLWKHPV